MSAQYRYLKIGVSVLAWSGVLLVTTYWSHTPVAFGQYSLNQLILLGLLVSIAVMAEHLADDIVSYWTKKSSTTKVARHSEWWISHVTLWVTEIKAFAMGLAQTLSKPTFYLVNIVTSCKRVTRGLMSSWSHL
ncbi:hypothetical protein [Nitrospira sp. BLG_2]|uniref:hypothetical protein n=1 Tax=Nitrospira sp. BLG_2 TaxID=3397507 RepID=UPI003B9B0A08